MKVGEFMNKEFDFYKRQITDFSRSISELNALIEDLANNDSLTDAEYEILYNLALKQI